MKKVLLILGLAAIILSALAVQCPEEDENSNATYFPHETECGEFYECHNGAASVLTCPPGLYWDSRLNVCNRDVDCGNLRTSTPPPATTAAPVTDPPITDSSDEEN